MYGLTEAFRFYDGPIEKVEGGIKANVIAPEAQVRFGFRPLPSQDTDEKKLLRPFERAMM